MKTFLVLTSLLICISGFSQKFGTLLVSDYDDPTLSLDGVAVWYGQELLGTTDASGSFYFPRKIKGTITLKRPDYLSRELKVKTRENSITDTNLMVTPAVYDSRKQAAIPEIYRSCIGDSVSSVPLSGSSGSSADAFNDYVEKMMRYPNRARDARTSGTVELRFRVSETGDVDCVEIVKGVDFELDKEAFRILSFMPQWKPAKHNGIPVARVYTASISFIIR